jgi:PAS domain S-box-containing protein
VPENLPYETLIDRYKELQLRVTRFSSIEQELINTRDRLDQELLLYKRLQHYSSLSLNINNEDELLIMMGEALIDILEIESAVVVYNPFTPNSDAKIICEGIKSDDSGKKIATDLIALTTDLNKGRPHLLCKDKLGQSENLNLFSSAIFGNYFDKELKFEILFFAAISKENEKLYLKIEEKHLDIFGVFINQMQSVLANKKRSEQIENQIELISKSEHELRKLSLIATKSKSGVIIADSYGRVEWVNDAFSQISGYQLDEIIGKKPKDFLQGPDATPEKRKALSDALSDKKDIEIVIVNHNKKGEAYYNQLEIVSVFDDAGKHVNFIAIQKDITGEIEQQREILKMNSRFQLITQFSQIGIWEWDVSSNEVNWNDVAFQLMGIKKTKSNEQLFQQWKNAIIDEDRDKIMKGLDGLIHENISFVKQIYRITKADDLSERVIQSQTIAERDVEGKLLRLVGSLQDITEVKKLQHNLESAVVERDSSLKKIHELKGFYERILNHSPSEILVFNKDLELTFINASKANSNSVWNNFGHFKFTELKENSHIQGIKEAVNTLEQAVSERKLIQSEDRFTDQEGNVIYYLRNILPYINEKNELENVIVIGVDITEQKNIQEDVLYKNKELSKINMELDQFVYSISHDLRSPLLSIKGIISLVLQSQGLNPENVKLLNLTLNSASRLDNTIQEILEYSRNSRTEVSHADFDLKEMIQNVFDDLRFSSHTNISMNLNVVGDPIVFSDKARMGVVLKNVIGNSIKYKREDIDAKIDIQINHQKDILKITVTDNGEGIPQKHLIKVFDMFYRGTTTSVGTGLGLYICKEIVNKLGGQIELESEPGLGTSLYLTFKY